MKIFLMTFGIFIAVIFAMSIGFIIKRRSIKGSCGGITALGMKKMCDCKEPCDNLKARVEAGDEKAKAEIQTNFQEKFYEVK